MKRLGFILIIVIFLGGCTEEDKETAFKNAEKQYSHTGFVAANDYSANERTICLGKTQSDDSIVAESVANINITDDVLSFFKSSEFLLIERPPEAIAENCLYVKRGYADSKRQAIAKGDELSRVETIYNDK